MNAHLEDIDSGERFTIDFDWSLLELRKELEGYIVSGSSIDPSDEHEFNITIYVYKKKISRIPKMERILV